MTTDQLDSAFFDKFEALLDVATKLIIARDIGEHPELQAQLECDVINAASDLTEISAEREEAYDSDSILIPPKGMLLLTDGQYVVPFPANESIPEPVVKDILFHAWKALQKANAANTSVTFVGAIGPTL